MQRKNIRLITAINWRQKTTLLFGLFLYSACIFFTSSSIAETNARGIEIEFLNEDVLDIELVSADANSDIPALDVTERNLWIRIQNGYAMSDLSSPYTTKYENLYASKPDYVNQMMVRSEKYLFYVVEEVEKRGMPMEIALLPMIESAYNPKALSRSKALGIWQFMPATGKHFGLKQNWWADHRRDVTASTDAALNYLEKLHGMFDSWELALAAYNAGEGRVGRAIKKNQRLGLPTDYQSLKLPVETTHYVPKLQAIKNIVTNPQQYGLDIAPIANKPYFAEIDAPNQIDAKLAAELADIPHKEFALLNPRYNRPIVASRNNSHKLLLPIASIEVFETNLRNHDKPLISWKVYKAKGGERVSNIAKKFSINTSQLRKVNGLAKNRKITRSLHLLVPAGNKKVSEINIAKLEKQKVRNGRGRHATHKIRRGETLSALAKRYGTNTRALMKINRLKSTRLKIGQIIRVKGKRLRAKTKRI